MCISAGKVLIIGGGIANFTNVAATFKVSREQNQQWPGNKARLFPHRETKATITQQFMYACMRTHSHTHTHTHTHSGDIHSIKWPDFFAGNCPCTDRVPAQAVGTQCDHFCASRRTKLPGGTACHKRSWCVHSSQMTFDCMTRALLCLQSHSQATPAWEWDIKGTYT